MSAVNDPPTVTADTGTTNEDTPFTSLNVLNNDVDRDGNSITVSAFDATSARGASVSVTPNGILTYDPTTSAQLQALRVGLNLTDTFTYTVSDGNGGTSVGSVTMTVTGANDIPLALPDAANVQKNATVTIDVLANDRDPDNDVLTVFGVNKIGRAHV